MTEVKFFNPDHDPGTGLTYSVIASQYKDKWLFVRHHKRTTYEIAGGHIEEGETPEQAASRELHEETGAIKFDISCVATYSVTKDGETGWGRLYYALIHELGPIPDISEIQEVIMLDTIPEHPTHPDIQPHLFRRVLDYLAGQ